MTLAIVLGLLALLAGGQWLLLAFEDGLRIQCSSGACQVEDLVSIRKCETQALIEARARTGSLLKTEEQIAFRGYALRGWALCLVEAGYTFTPCKMHEDGCARREPVGRKAGALSTGPLPELSCSVACRYCLGGDRSLVLSSLFPRAGR